MEAKKTPKADLEKRRGLYLEIGLVVILALALVAFNIKSYDKEVKEVNTRVAESEIAFELANAYLEKFGHDNMTDIRAAIAAYKQRLRTAAK